MKIIEISLKNWLLVLIVIFIVVPAVWLLTVKLEGEQPVIRLEKDFTAIGKYHQLSVVASDEKSGLKKVWLGLLKDGKEITLQERDYSQGRWADAGRVNQDAFNVVVEPKKMAVGDGKALLRMAVWDRSWRSWFKGNRGYVEKEIRIDTKPPVISIMSRAHYFSQGGTGLVIYRVSEPCSLSGVVVGEEFFNGYSGYFKDADVYLAFIGLSHQQGPGTEIYARADDLAGNRTKTGVSCYIRKKIYRKDAIRISDRFLNWKMPEFETDIPEIQQLSLVEKFLKVNRDLRKSSYQKIVSQVDKSEKDLIWQGPFLRLPKSARKSAFADRREYFYQGKIIDRQFHLGVDLASLEQSTVPASNSGKTVFTGRAGIYGNTVILDHGFGLFSMYAHLSRMDTKPGQKIKKGTPIGRTGVSGLAGGDHLHFGVLVQRTLVNPIEWWDAAWIKNNITAKLDAVRARLGEE